MARRKESFGKGVPEGQRPLFSDHKGEKLIVDSSASPHLLSADELRKRLGQTLGEVDPKIIATAARRFRLGETADDVAHTKKSSNPEKPSSN